MRRIDPQTNAAPLDGVPFAGEEIFKRGDLAAIHDVIAVAIDIRPNFDALSNDTPYRKTATLEERMNIFNMKGAAVRGALDSLSCFVHGDAIDMERPVSIAKKETPSEI